MRFIELREAMWGVVQQGISELEFNFAAYVDGTSRGWRRRQPARASDTRWPPWIPRIPPKAGAVPPSNVQASIRSSSYSVPCRIGPLNHFQPSTYQPPKSTNAPPTMMIV